jgi:hypothetical protein
MDDRIEDKVGSESSEHHPPMTIGEEMEDQASDEEVETGDNEAASVLFTDRNQYTDN